LFPMERTRRGGVRAKVSHIFIADGKIFWQNGVGSLVKN